ncbi:hypothetical protein HAX54_003935 [Datura stramonium]|uniref:C17orf113 probable zinc finger domain-containing protein n=1 Tax=Datura stramonium TaxID=4076 RepID=A0ABS8RTR1_DATST|nr:hypothetical protein [Datura stramonium]
MRPGDDDPSFSNNTLINVPPQESAAEDHDESKQMMIHQASGGNQDLLKSQPAKEKKVVKIGEEEYGEHRRNPYGNEGSRNMQMSALEEHNNSLLHKEALRLQMASKDKIVVDKPIYVKKGRGCFGEGHPQNCTLTTRSKPEGHLPTLSLINEIREIRQKHPTDASKRLQEGR